MERKPFKMKVRLYNNRLICAREELGLTQRAAAVAIDVSLGTLNGLETLRKQAWGDSGWKKQALTISTFYGYSPEYLWPEEIALVKRTAMQLELAVQNVHVLVGEDLDQRELEAKLAEAKRRLPVYDVKLLEAHFSDEKTYQKLGQELPGVNDGASPERMRQLVLRAEDRLREAFRQLDAEERQMPLDPQTASRVWKWSKKDGESG